MARDYTKYNITDIGENFNKGQLVFQIVKSYTSTNHPEYTELKEIFPDQIQGSLGVLCKKSEVKDFKRYSKESIKTVDGVETYVCNQWGENISEFIAVAEKLGYEISKNNTAPSSESSQEVSSDYLDIDLEVRKDNGSLICSIKNFKCDVSGDNFFVKDSYDALLEEFSPSLATSFVSSDIIGKFENNIYQEIIDNSIPSGSEYGTTVNDMKSTDYNWYEECPHLVITRVGAIDFRPIVCFNEDDDEMVNKAMEMTGADSLEQLEDEIENYFVDARWSVDDFMFKNLL